MLFEDYHSFGSPLFVFEPPNGVEPFSHDYKSSVMPIYQGGNHILLTYHRILFKAVYLRTGAISHIVWYNCSHERF